MAFIMNYSKSYKKNKNNSNEIIKKEFYYYRKYCYAWYYGHKIKSFIYKKIYEYYSDKHIRIFAKGGK